MASISDPPFTTSAQRGGLSLRSKLIATFVGVVLLALLGSGAASTLVASNALTSVVGTQLDSRADEKATTLALYLDQQVTSIKVLALNQSIISGIKITNLQYPASQGSIRMRLNEYEAQWRSLPDNAPIFGSRIGRTPVAETLRDFRALAPDHIELIVADAFGGLVAATDRTSDFDQSDEAWWQTARRGEIYISQPEFDASAGVSALLIAVPVVDPSTETIVGVARTTFQLRALAAQIDNVRFGETGGALLLLSDDLRLNGDSSLSGVDPAARNLLDAATTSQFVIGAFDGTPRVISVAPLTRTPEIDALGWQLAFYQNEGEAMGPLIDARSAQLVSTLVALVVSAVLALVIARRISAPLTRLAAAAEGIAAGDFSRRVGGAGSDELGRLAQSFDLMSTTLEQRISSEQTAQAERLRLQDEVIRVQRDTLKALATPLIPLNDNFLLLPLVGKIDNERAEQIFQVLLHGVAERRAHRVIIDLTGVPTLEAQVAETLLRAAQGARLMGAEVVLTGISGALALTLTQLAIPLDQIAVVANLERALAPA